MISADSTSHIARARAIAAVVTVALTCLACYPEDEEFMDSTLTRPPVATEDGISTRTAEAMRSLARRRVYFGHQSVGGNLIAGMQSLIQDSDVGLRLVETHDPASVAGPAFVHFLAGQNEDPDSKNADFLKVLDARPTQDSAVVLMKYCYIDVNASTNIDSLFGRYRTMVNDVRGRHPDVTLVHVTMPLTTDASGPKPALKRLLGLTTGREINVKRARFNHLLRTTFRDEPLFDLARLEATQPGERVDSVMVDNQVVLALAPANSTDGGHLTDDASRRIGSRLIEYLGELSHSGGR